MEIMSLNDVLQDAYTTLTENVVGAVNVESVIDFLFAAKVLSNADYRELSYASDRHMKTRRLMALLHNGGHPEAFVKLHEAIKRESAYDWLAEQIDDVRSRLKDAASTSSKLVKDVFKPTATSTPTLKHVVINDNDGRPVVGVTSVDSRLFVLRDPSRQQVQVYDTKSFKQQPPIVVKGLGDSIRVCGFTSCATNNCIYVSASETDYVCKVELSDGNKILSWSVDHEPRSLLVNAACNLIVACRGARKIQVYNTTSRSLVREICLRSNDVVLRPLHAIQLTRDQFVVSCWNETNDVYDVVEVGTNGRLIVSYTDQLKSTKQHEFDFPRQFTVDKNNEFIFVTDRDNNRIVILNRSRECCARELNMLSADGGLQVGLPSCLYFNVTQNQLFVGEGRGNRRVLVFGNVI